MSDTEKILQDNLEHTLFSWSNQAGLKPMNIERAEGVYLYDREGKRIIDFSSQLMNVNIGHGNKKVQEAVAQQMNEVSYVFPGAITKARGDLGKKLAEIAPGSLNKTFFTLGGAEAIENAIKLARVYTGRHKIIAQYRSYHGGTYGAMSAGGDPRKHPIDSQQVPNIIHVENPYFYRCPWHSNNEEECAERSAANMERVIQFEGPDNVAAILMEGESGSSGCIKYPADYWKRIKEIADRYGILIIDDEVMSGFGRTGKMFAFQHSNIQPDGIMVGKALSGGTFPISAFLTTNEVASAIQVGDHGSTFGGSALACAVALEALAVVEDEHLVENSAAMGEYLLEQLKTIDSPFIDIVRGKGLFVGVKLIGIDARVVCEALLKNGVVSKDTKGCVIRFAPPLTIKKEEIDFAVQRLKLTLNQL